MQTVELLFCIELVACILGRVRVHIVHDCSIVDDMHGGERSVIWPPLIGHYNRFFLYTCVMIVEVPNDRPYVCKYVAD